MDNKPYIKNTIVARGLVVSSSNQILLVSDNGKNWHLPGGMLDDLEDARQSCEREVYEETGLKIQALDVFYIHQGIFDSRKRFNNFLSSLTLYFITKILETENIDPNWQDPDGNLIQHRQYFHLNDVIDHPNIGRYTNDVLKYIQKIGIKNLPSLPFDYDNGTGLNGKEILNLCK